MVNRESPSPYDEVDGFATVLGYRTSTAGPCKAPPPPPASYLLENTVTHKSYVYVPL